MHDFKTSVIVFISITYNTYLHQYNLSVTQCNNYHSFIICSFLITSEK